MCPSSDGTGVQVPRHAGSMVQGHEARAPSFPESREASRGRVMAVGFTIAWGFTEGLFGDPKLLKKLLMFRLAGRKKEGSQGAGVKNGAKELLGVLKYRQDRRGTFV